MNRSHELAPAELLSDIAAPRTRPFQPETEGLPLREIWHVLRKRRWLIFLVFTSAITAVTVVTFTTTPIYTAEALLLIERRAPRVMHVETALAESLGTDEEIYYKTQYEILKSPGIAARVIQELELTSDQIVPPGWIDDVMQFAASFFPGNSRPAPPGRVNPRLIKTYSRDGLAVEAVRSSRVVRVGFRTPDPELSARVANAHARAYAEQGLEQRARANEEARAFLDRKLLDLKARVEASETALNDYRRSRGIVSLDDKENIVIEGLEDLTEQLAVAEGARIQLEAQFELIKKRHYQSLPAVIESELIWKLKEELAIVESEHAAQSTSGSTLSDSLWPEQSRLAQLGAQRTMLQERIDSETRRIIGGIESAYLAATANERALRERMSQQTERALQLKDDAVGYAILARDADANRQLYRSVLERMKEMSISAELSASNVFIVNEAYPPVKPSRPRKLMNLSLGLILGLVAALGIAFARESLGSSLETPEELEYHLQVPTLGAVPDLVRVSSRRFWQIARRRALSSPAAESERLVALHEPRSASTEAYRRIRTSLLFSRAGEPPRVLLFTSALAGEGKTLTTLNMSVVFAQLGGSVLLVDADLRRARCEAVLEVERGVGLTELLTGQIALDGAVHSTPWGFDLLGGGDLPPNPTELLGSQAMAELLRGLRKRYAYVLLDAPPVVPVSDASVLSQMVDGVVLVVDRKTPRNLVQRARSQLDASGARILGAVLNGADPAHPAHASYFRGYET